MKKQHGTLQSTTEESIIIIVKRDTEPKGNKMYSSYNYNPPASYYEPPEEPSWDKEEARVLDDVFFLVLTFDGEEDDEGIEYGDSLKTFYKDIEGYKEDGLTKMEVYEAVQDFGIYYGKHEDDYYEEEISEKYSGDLLYSEEF